MQGYILISASRMKGVMLMLNQGDENEGRYKKLSCILEMIRRQDVVDGYCNRRRVYEDNALLEEDLERVSVRKTMIDLLTFEQDNLAWCPVYKVKCKI